MTAPAASLLADILDRAYAEWREAGSPAGEAVVHLNEFQRAGLWSLPSDPSQTSARVDALPAARAASPSAQQGTDTGGPQ